MNRKVLVTETYLENIADAIREKAVTTTLYRPPNMASAIRGIKTLSATVTGTTLSLVGNGASVTGTTVAIENNG